MTGGQPVDGPVSVQAIAHSCPRRGRRADRAGLRRPRQVPHRRPARAAIDDPPPPRAGRRAARAARGLGRLGADLRADLRHREAPPPQARHDGGPEALRRHQRARLRGLRRLLGRVELPERRAGRDRVRPQAPDQPVDLQQGLSPASTASAPASSPSRAATRRKKSGVGIDTDALLARRPGARPAAARPARSTCWSPASAAPASSPSARSITMAAHLEGKGSSVLDFTGFAQKFGPVLSFIRLGRDLGAINQVRIDARSADAVIGCDVVVSSSPKASACYRPGTRVALNLAEMPTGDVVRQRDARLNVAAREAADRRRRSDADNVAAFDANAACRAAAGRQRLRQRDDAGLRLAAGARPGLVRRAGPRDRAERRGGRPQHARLLAGPHPGRTPRRAGGRTWPLRHRPRKRWTR